MAAKIGRPGLDLDKDQDLALQDHQIQFVGAGAPVGREDDPAGPAVVPGGQPLALRPQAPVTFPPPLKAMPPRQEIHAGTRTGEAGAGEPAPEGFLT